MRVGFLALRRATLTVQTRWRMAQEQQSTLLQAVQERIRFLCMRRAAVEVQRVWRGYRVRAGFGSASGDDLVGALGGGLVGQPEGRAAYVAVGGLEESVSGESLPGVLETASTPPLSPRREEELYRQLAELQMLYLVEERGSPSQTATTVELRTEEGLHSNGGSADSDGKETSPAVRECGLRTETLSVASDLDGGGRDLDGGPEATPPMSPRGEEALYLQLADLLPSYENLTLYSTGETGEEDLCEEQLSESEELATGSGPSGTDSAALGAVAGTSGVDRCGEMSEETRKPGVVHGVDRKGLHIGVEEGRELEEEEDVDETGALSPASVIEGPLTPHSESALLTQLAGLICKHAPAVMEPVTAVVESTPAATKHATPVTEPGADFGTETELAAESGRGDGKQEAAVVLQENGPTLSGGEVRRGGALQRGPETTVPQEAGAKSASAGAGELLAMHQAALRALKKEEVASWRDRKPLDMVVVTAGDRHVPEVVCVEALARECPELKPAEGGKRRKVAQEEDGLALIEPQKTAEETSASTLPPPGTLGKELEAVSEAQPEACTGSDVSDGLSPLRESDVRTFDGPGLPSSGDCTPEHYAPTESDASVFALQKPDPYRTPVSSPALLLAETALLDSASKVASWNDAAANVPLSEENMRVSIAAPGGSPWGLAQYDFARAGASAEWPDGFPDDSWTNSPSHRSFMDQDSSLGEVKVSDCPSPDKSLGLVRAEVEKLNSLQKGQFTSRMGSPGHLGVNRGKPLTLGSTEWAQMRLGLGLLKQWLVENESVENGQVAGKGSNVLGSQSPAKPNGLEMSQSFEKPSSPGVLQSGEKHQSAESTLNSTKPRHFDQLEGARSPIELQRIVTPHHVCSLLVKSKSESALDGSDDALNANPASKPLGQPRLPPSTATDSAGSKPSVVRQLTLPLRSGLGSPSSPNPATESSMPAPVSSPLSKPTFETRSPSPQESGFPLSPSNSSPTGHFSVDLPSDPELCDSPDISPALPKSPERGATFDSFAAPPLERLHSAPQPRTAYAHSPHRQDGRDCLVCRLWEEGSFVGFQDSPR